MDQETKNLLELVVITSSTLYVLGYKPTLDFWFGADSPFSRYLYRPFANYLFNNAFKTEEQFQAHMESIRYKIANQGSINLATLLTFPWGPNYEAYREDKNL